jgi:4-hydroxy-2-oxoheptanedioate aldolase
VATAEAIAAVPDLAGLHVGPVDLGLGLGLGMDRSAPAFGAALAGIVAASRTVGIPAVMHAVKAQDAGRWLALGFSELVLTADVEVLRSGLRSQLLAARDILAAGQ